MWRVNADAWCDAAAQALECFQKANEAAGGHADYTARIKVLRQKTGTQQKVAKVHIGTQLWGWMASGTGWNTHTHEGLGSLLQLTWLLA